MIKKVFSTVFSIFLTCALLAVGGLLFLNNRIQNLKQQKQACNDQLAEKEDEIKYLLSDTAKPLGLTEVPYSFYEFGIYSPFFIDKTIKVENFSYKRSQFKKMTVKVQIPTTGNHMVSAEDSNYLVEVWEYPHHEKVDKYGVSQPDFQGITNYDMVFVNNSDNIKVTPLSEIVQRWDSKNTYINSHRLSLHMVSFVSSSPYISSLESEVGLSPNGNPHFLRIRPAFYLYYSGTFSYNPQNSDFLYQVTENIKNIGNTISYVKY